MEHRCTPMAVADRYQCTGGSYSAELAELDATLSFSLTIRATRSDSTVMLLEPSVSVTCEGAGCGSEALGLVAPCTVGTQRGLVYEGPTAGALAVP